MRFLFILLLLTKVNWLGAQPMRVLFVGNSFTHYNNMPQLFERMALSKGIHIEVLMDAKSNHTFEMHAKRPELYANIRSKKWDYVVLQGFSRELAQDKKVIDSTCIPFVRQLLDSIYNNNKCTNVLLYQTWGYDGGYKDDSLGINWTYQEMSDRIHQGYLYLSEIFNLSIVPVGKVWETVKENHPQIDLYQADKQHPSYAGSYLSAYCFYAALFKVQPVFEFQSALNKEHSGIIHEIAGNTILINKQRYGIKKNTVEIEAGNNQNNKKEVYFNANYPNAKSIKWEFGDGMSESIFKTKHVYSAPGTYEIFITVQDGCGERFLKRQVIIKP